MPRRDPPAEKFKEALDYLISQGFKPSIHKFGPKTRVDLGWPDDRRGIRLAEWRIVEIADAWRKEQAEAAARDRLEGGDGSAPADGSSSADSSAPADGPSPTDGSAPTHAPSSANETTDGSAPAHTPSSADETTDGSAPADA